MVDFKAMAKKRKKLTGKQFRFCIEYTKDRNAYNALKRAGYNTSGVTARSMASRLLARPEIQSEIQKHADNLLSAEFVTVERVVKELAILGFYDPADYAIWDENGHLSLKASVDLPPGASRAISEITHDTRTTQDGETTSRVKIKFHSKGDALGKLGDFLGMFKKRVELSDPSGRNPLTAALEDLWHKLESREPRQLTTPIHILPESDE